MVSNIHEEQPTVCRGCWVGKQRGDIQYAEALVKIREADDVLLAVMDMGEANGRCDEQGLEESRRWSRHLLLFAQVLSHERSSP